MVKKLAQSRVPIAAICAATTLLADLKLLDSIKHTSNSKEFLIDNCPGYQGQEHYSSELAVTDGNIITSSGVAALEFAKEILEFLKVYDKEAIEKWYQLFKFGIWQK